MSEARRSFFLTNSSDMMAREGVGAEMAPWEDGLRQDTGKGKFEWWYFDAHLDDGSKLVVVILTKPIIASSGPLNPKVEISLTRPDGQVITDWSYPGPLGFSASRDSCEVKAGANSVHGDLGTYIVEVAGKKLKARLEFKRIVPSWRSGAGKVYFDEGLGACMGWVVPIPFGAVSGSITEPEGERAVRGEGYHDHNWGNYPIENVFDYWFWGRARVGRYTVLFFDGVGSKKWGGAHLPLFMMSRDGAVVAPEAAGYSVAPSDMIGDREKHGRPFPTKLRVSQSGGGVEASFSFSEPRIAERDDMLVGAAPAWLVPALRPFINPWYYRFDAALEADIACSGCEQERLRGRGLYELMLFGKAEGLRVRPGKAAD